MGFLVDDCGDGVYYFVFFCGWGVVGLVVMDVGGWCGDDFYGYLGLVGDFLLVV